MQRGQYLHAIYKTLNAHFGDLNWWPGNSPFEVIVGAVLTQNTAWRNVEKAIARLKTKELLHPAGILEIDNAALADLIKPAGYYNIKTQRLKAFVRFLYDEYGGKLNDMCGEELWRLRAKLLMVKGIGEETADSILLYAARKPIFVVDTYTRRVLQRHDLIRSDATYKEIQDLFMTHLPHSVPLYNQYHALFVNTGKIFCTKKPRCEGCPLKAQSY